MLPSHTSPALPRAASADLLKPKRGLMDAYYATVKSAPRIGFGSAMRPGMALGDAESSPGPGAHPIGSTLMGSPSSTIASPPCFSLRGREKFGSPDLKAVDRTAQLEPGPNHYQPRIINPNARNAPKYTFPKDPGPWACNKAHRSPGPGHYAIPPAVGKQVLSTKHTHNGAVFGTGNRPPLILVSTADVGPGEYRVGGSIGEKQMESQRRNNGAIRFGVVKRKRPSKRDRAADEVPGPGSYRLPAAMCDYSAASPYKTAPRTYMAGREAFGSPFGW